MYAADEVLNIMEHYVILESPVSQQFLVEGFESVVWLAEVGSLH